MHSKERIRMRLVSICPSNTEMLYFLGAHAWLVGMDDYSDWPPSCQHLPRVGPDLNVDIEKIKALHPDLVIASLSVPGMEKNIERLKQENLPFIVLNPKTLRDIAQDLIRLGDALGLQTKAEKTARRFTDQIDRLKARIPGKEKPPRLYWEWWPKPVFTPGRRNWLTEVSELVGAVNIFSDIDKESVQTDWETVRDKKPDYVLAVWTGVPLKRIKKEMIQSRPPWQGTPLCKEQNIFLLDEGWYCRPSPRILTGLYHLAHLLYPETFSPPDPDHPFPLQEE
jgi:iron complex transport system substrate-binding protein